MVPEVGGIVAAFLFSVAAVAGGLALFRVRGPWELVAIGARVAGTVAVAIALISAMATQGEWSPFNPWQVALSLILAMSGVQLLLAWRLGLGSAGPLVDLVALALLLLTHPSAPWAVVPFEPVPFLLSCTQRTLPFQVQWALFLLGSGSLLAAGSAGLMLALCRVLAERAPRLKLPPLAGWVDLLIQSTFLALVAVGGGLTLGAWWAWQAVGRLTAGDSREAWMALVWLLAATSLAAWQLERHRARWAAGFAGLAAAMVLFGLLALVELQALL
jgi:hypothetical protein